MRMCTGYEFFWRGWGVIIGRFELGEGVYRFGRERDG